MMGDCWWRSRKEKECIPLLTLSLPLHDLFIIQKTRAKVLSTIKTLLLAVFVVLYFISVCSAFLSSYHTTRKRVYSATNASANCPPLMFKWQMSEAEMQLLRGVQMRRRTARSASIDRERLKMIAQSYAEMSANATWCFSKLNSENVIMNK